MDTELVLPLTSLLGNTTLTIHSRGEPMKKKLSILASLSVFGLSACGSKPMGAIVIPTAQEANTLGAIQLEVDVSKLRSAKGQICFALFDDAKGFPNTQESVVKSGCQTIVAGSEPGKSLLVIEDIAASSDSFALSLFHDENSNGNLDKKKILGIEIPAEGFGMSNNPPTRMAPPTWEECVFHPTEGTNQLAISFKYL